MWKYGAMMAVALSVFGQPLEVQAGGVDINSITLPNDRNRANIASSYEKSSRQDTFTLAVSPTGSWGMRDRTKGMTSADRQQSALQKCEHFAGQPCGLVMVDGKVVDYVVTPSMSYPASYSVDAIPFVRAENREKLRQKYSPNKKYSALALHRNGGYGYATGRDSQAAANSAAIGYCIENNRKDCFIYDESGAVVFKKGSPLRD